MKIPFGLRLDDDRVVGPDLVQKGLDCGCICAECRLPLIAKQGPIKIWHFAHASGGDCPGAVETAIHRMAKQMIIDRRAIYVPGHIIERYISGPTWQTVLKGEVQAEGLVQLRACQEETRIDTRQPDITAILPNGMPIAIEVAFSHFCDQEKIVWLKERDLTALEIDISIPQVAKSNEIEEIVAERLFQSCSRSVWLHHAQEVAVNVTLDQQEQILREHYAKADAAKRAEDAKAQDTEKRKAKFKESIRDVADETYRLTSDLTLRIAHSKARVTMKGHGYFKTLPDYFKHMIFEAGQAFGGKFNKEYSVWEFWTDEDLIYPLYKDLCKFVEARLQQLLTPKRSAAPQAPPISEPSVAAQYNLSKDEVELFEERAAIIEFETRCNRQEAEQLAFDEIQARRRKDFF
jgi:hypothetical protein